MQKMYCLLAVVIATVSNLTTLRQCSWVVVPHTFNSPTWEAETGLLTYSVNSRPA